MFQNATIMAVVARLQCTGVILVILELLHWKKWHGNSTVVVAAVCLAWAGKAPNWGLMNFYAQTHEAVVGQYTVKCRDCVVQFDPKTTEFCRKTCRRVSQMWLCFIVTCCKMYFTGRVTVRVCVCMHVNVGVCLFLKTPPFSTQFRF